MFYIKNNKILLTKGDSAEFEISVYNKDGEILEILPTDIITFSVRQNANSPIILSKTAYIETFYLVPADTTSLPSGLYVYDIQFVRDDEVSTIASGFFDLREEITDE